MRLLLVTALALCVAWGASPAHAQEGRPVVVLVRPAGASAMIDEMIGRARAELEASGFEARIVEAEPGAAPRTTIEAADARAIAAIAVVDPSGDATVEVWVDDRLSGKVSIRPLVASETDEHKAAAVLAIQAVELLRASLVEIARTPRSDTPPPARPPPAAAVAFARPPGPPRPVPRPQRAELALAAGPAAFVGFDPASVQLAPSFALALGAPSGLGGRVRWVGPGLGPDLDAPGGEFALSSWLITAGLRYAPPTAGRWFAFVTADAGVFQLSAEGTLEAPATSRAGSSLAAAFLAGGGGGLRLADNLALVLAAEVLVTAPRITVEIGGDQVATAGRPGGVLSLGLRISR